MKQKPTILQVASILLTAISITLSVFFYLEKKKNETLGSIIADQARSIIQADVIISQHNRRIDEMVLESKADKLLMREAIIIADRFYHESIKAQGIIEQLTIQLNEKPAILPFDDNEQYRIFMEWSVIK